MQIQIVVVKGAAVSGYDDLIVGQRERKVYSKNGAKVDVFAALEVNLNRCSAKGAVEDV